MIFLIPGSNFYRLRGVRQRSVGEQGRVHSLLCGLLCGHWERLEVSLPRIQEWRGSLPRPLPDYPGLGGEANVLHGDSHWSVCQTESPAALEMRPHRYRSGSRNARTLLHHRYLLQRHHGLQYHLHRRQLQGDHRGPALVLLRGVVGGGRELRGPGKYHGGTTGPAQTDQVRPAERRDK